MKGVFIKKVLVFSVVFLFILTSLSSVYADFNINSKTTYITIEPGDPLIKSIVSDNPSRQLVNRLKKSVSTDGEDWDIIVPDDYQTIQEAIDHAHEYNIIHVRSGIYYEHIIVDVNAIQIIGEDLNNTIIDGEGNGNVVEIKGFMIGLHGLNFRNGEIGVTFTGLAPTFNIVSGNIISQNQIGIKLYGASRSNSIYHNNFIGNNQNAFDQTDSNIWYYDLEIQEGNYWDDYIGTDDDEDGIGDIPYNIPGGDNKDEYPLMKPHNFHFPPEQPSKPSGPSCGKIMVEYTYMTETTDPYGGQVYYWWNWDDGTTTGWMGPYDSGQPCEVTHSWSNMGRYDIRVKAKNEYGAISVWSPLKSISMPKNKNMLKDKEQLIEGLLTNLSIKNLHTMIFRITEEYT